MKEERADYKEKLSIYKEELHRSKVILDDIGRLENPDNIVESILLLEFKKPGDSNNLKTNVKLKNILAFAKSKSNYRSVYINEDGQIGEFECRKTIKELENMLPSSLFGKVNKSVIVNFSIVKAIKAPYLILDKISLSKKDRKISKVFGEEFTRHYLEFKRAIARSDLP